jgi:hypothetical protein
MFMRKNPPCFTVDCLLHGCDGCPGVEANSMVYDFSGMVKGKEEGEAESEFLEEAP